MALVIVFDLDGTLFDSMDGYTVTFAEQLFEEYEIPREHSMNFYRKSAGMELADQFAQMLSKYSDAPVSSMDARVKKLMREFWDIQKKNTPPLFDDVVPALEGLGNFRKYVASGTSQEIVEARIKNYGLEKYFMNWVGYSAHNNKRTYLEFLSNPKNGIVERRDHLYFVGDGLSDMRLAKELKVNGIGLVRGGAFSPQEMREAGADKVVTSLLDVKDTIYHM